MADNPVNPGPTDSALADLERRNRELSTLNAISSAASQSLDLAVILRVACTEVSQVLGGRAACVLLLDEELTGGVEVGATQSLPASVVEQLESIRWEPLASNPEPNGPQRLPPLQQISQALRGILRSAGYRSFTLLALHTQGKPVGVLGVADVEDSIRIPGVDWVWALGGQLGALIDNARLHRATQRRVAELDALAQLSRAISSTLDLDRVLDIATRQTRDIVGASSIVVRLIEDNELVVRASAGLPEPNATVLRAPISDAIRTLFQEHMTQPVDDIERDAQVKENIREIARIENVRAYLVVPMRAEGEPVGLMSIAHDSPHRWHRREMEFVQTIASQVAVAVRNVRLYQAILTEQRKIEIILNQIADGVFTTDTECHITAFNASAESLTGWRFSEIKGLACRDVLMARGKGGQPACLTAKTCFCRQALNGASPITSRPVRRLLATRDGQTIPVTGITSPLLDEAGRVIGTVTAFWDARREEEVERLKTDFVSLVSHELRSPLTNIKAAAQMGLRHRDSAEAISYEELLNIIVGQCDRLLLMVDRILQVARLKAGKMKIETRPFDLATLVTRTVERWTREHPAWVFEATVQHPLPLVEADEVHIRTVLEGLLDNAVKYTPPGTPIYIAVRSDGPQLRVTVADRGPGIPHAHQAHLFEQFYRIPGTSKPGYGLGLYFARLVIEAQGGNIWIESEAGSGTQVHFTLPQVHKPNKRGRNSRTATLLREGGRS